MANHYSFGSPRRARGIDNVGQIIPARLLGWSAMGAAGLARSKLGCVNGRPVQTNNWDFRIRQIYPWLGQQQPGACILQTVVQSFSWIRRIQGHVGRASL